MRSDVGALEKKWLRLRSLVRHIRHVSFVDFVLVSGSMATGEATEESDFDLLVGARAGRIFTVREVPTAKAKAATKFA